MTDDDDAPGKARSDIGANDTPGEPPVDHPKIPQFMTGDSKKEQRQQGQRRRQRRQRRRVKRNGDKQQERFEKQLHQRNIANQQGGYPEGRKAEYLNQLLQTGMNDAEVNMISNMLDRAWMLGNIKQQQYEDIQWWLKGRPFMIEALFPPDESMMTGIRRAIHFDDASEALEPLTDQQKEIIKQALRGIEVGVVSRSVSGFQQEQTSKSVSVSEVREEDNDESGSLVDRVRGIRR